MNDTTLTDAVLLVITHLPDADSADELAAALVGERLAACVNVLPACRSVYRWQGEIERIEEVPLAIKTSAACYAALEAAIRARHPYELPEIVALPLQGLSDYLAWVVRETGAAAEPNAGAATC